MEMLKSPTHSEGFSFKNASETWKQEARIPLWEKREHNWWQFKECGRESFLRNATATSDNVRAQVSLSSAGLKPVVRNSAAISKVLATVFKFTRGLTQACWSSKTLNAVTGKSLPRERLLTPHRTSLSSCPLRRPRHPASPPLQRHSAAPYTSLPLSSSSTGRKSRRASSARTGQKHGGSEQQNSTRTVCG